MKLRTKILIGFVAVLIIIALNFFQKRVRGALYYISAPIQKMLWSAGDKTSDFLSIIWQTQTLEKENDKLRLQNLQLISENNELQAIQQENNTLKQALDIGLEKEFDLSFGQIISHNLAKDTLLLSKGIEHGISQDLAVITEQKVLCGKISQVFQKFSQAKLISSKDISFDVVIGSVSGVAKGQGHQKIIIDLIPQDVLLQEQDLIFTAPSAEVFPDNLLVGKIKKVLRSDTEPFQQAEIEPACDIKELNSLFIIAN